MFDFTPSFLVGVNTSNILWGQNFVGALGLNLFQTADKTSKHDIFIQYHLGKSLSGGKILLEYGLTTFRTTIGGGADRLATLCFH